MDAAVPVAHPESHERAAVGEIDAAPVPAGRFGRHVGARPFVVEPRRSLDVPAVQLADHVELRAAVVVARLVRPVALAAEALLALQDELMREEVEIEREIAAAMCAS